MSLLQELKKRNVFKVAVFYLVSSWVILQVAALLFSIMELPAAWTKVLLILLIIGLPVSLIVSWVFEVTPEGLKRESEIGDADSGRGKSGQRMNVATIVIVLIGIGLLGVDRYFLSSTDNAGTVTETTSSEDAELDSVPIVAVLPFSASGSDDGGFLAGGLHDDLLTRLARLNTFHVISRTSMMEYAKTTKNMRQIGQELGAGFILEGRVQALGVRVRINATLIDARNDNNLWAKTYDRELTAVDLFDIQAELARAIATELSLTLSGSDNALIDSIPTENITAYYAYVRALDIRDRGGHNTPTSTLVIEALENAVQADPDFAEAWAHLSIAHSRYYQSFGGDSKHGAAALDARARAYALSPDLPQVIVADAVYQYRVLNEYQVALEKLEGLENAGSLPESTLILKAYLLRRLGLFEQAYQTVIDAYTLNPRSISIAGHIIEFSLQTGRCKEAESRVDAALALAPNNANIRTSAANYEMACTGNLDRADQHLSGMEFLEPWHFITTLRVKEARSDYQGILKLAETGTQYRNIPQLANILRADALTGLGTLDEVPALLDSIHTSLYNEDQDQAGEIPLSELVSKIQLARLQGDQNSTLRLVEEHRKLFRIVGKGDKNFEQSFRIVYAEALAAVGLMDQAVTELSNLMELPGAYPFLYIDIHPVFDDLDDHPGYQALRARYSNTSSTEVQTGL